MGTRNVLDSFGSICWFLILRRIPVCSYIGSGYASNHYLKTAAGSTHLLDILPIQTVFQCKTLYFKDWNLAFMS